jgi:hypothetical protein
LEFIAKPLYLLEFFMRMTRLLPLFLSALLLAGCGSEDNSATPVQSSGQRAQLAAATATPAAPAILTGPRANYTVAATASGYTITDFTGKDATLNVSSTARLRFADTSLGFDLDGVAGKCYRIYQAAFARTPDAAGLGYWIGEMDRGKTLAAVAAEFITSDEFRLRYGSSLSNLDLVKKLYLNVLGREGEPAGVSYWVGLLDNKLQTPSQVLEQFGESPENKAAILQVISNGVPFIEYGVSYSAADTPPGQSAGSGNLASNVSVLSAADNARIIASSDSSVTFSGAFSAEPGAILMGTDTVFKVVSLATQNGNTVVTTSAPSIDEIFESLEINGAYTATAAQAQTASSNGSQSGVRAQQGSASVGENFSFTGTLVDGNTTLTSTLSGGLRALIAYDYRRGSGLRSASITLNASTRLASQLHLAERASVTFEKQLGTVRILIPVSIYDRLLAAVGVRMVSLTVPFYVGASLSTEFDLKFSRTANVGGLVGLKYDGLTNTAVMNRAFSGQVDDTGFTSVTPSGAPALSTFKETASVYVKARPALSFLNTVAMAGVNVTLSGEGSATLQAPVPLTPFYCLVTTPSVNLSAFGFVRGAAFKETTSATQSAKLWTGIEARYGSCKAPVLITATASPSPGLVDSPLTVSATVRLDPAFAYAPGVAPSGKVSVAVAGGSCTITLAGAGSSSASGSCALTPTTGGAPASIALTYAGDTRYAAGTGTASHTIIDTRFAGTYKGTFSGDDSGSFTVVVSAAGTVTGSGLSKAGLAFSVSGSVDADGKVVISTGGSTSSGSVFKGSINVLASPATISGLWANAEFDEDGSFSGTRQ